MLCKFATVVRPTRDRFGNTKNTQVLTELLSGGKELSVATTARQSQQPAQRVEQPVAGKSADSAKS
ncbi:hypothetical protein D9M68_880130 [compost metagenome]